MDNNLSFIQPQDAWDRLSMKEKAEMMKVAVRNGITKLQDIRDKYNEFAEGGEVEANTFKGGGYKPSDSVRKRISAWEGTAMTGAVDPLSGKWGKNRSFEEEADSFYNVLPASIREQVLSNPELADNLFSYSYNVGAGNFRKRVVPALKRYYTGNGSPEDIANSMWATGDKKLRGLRKRRAVERKGVVDALTPAFVQEPADNTFVYNPFAIQASSTQVMPMMVPDEGSYVTTHEVSPSEQRAESIKNRFDAINRFNVLMDLINPQNNPIPEFIPTTGNSFFDALGLFANSNARGGKIHIKPSKRGTFTAAASKHGKSIQAFASQVLAHPENYSPAMRKKANFARNAAKWHGLGGNLYDGNSQPTQQMQKASDYRYVLDDDEEWNRVTNDEMGRVFQGLTVTPRKTKHKFVPKRIDNSLEAVKAREKFFQYRDEEGHIKGEPGLEIVSPEFELLMGARMAMPTYSQQAIKNYQVGRAMKLQPKNMPKVNKEFRSEEWGNFLNTRNGDNYYRMANIEKETANGYSPKENYFVSHTTPWEEFSGMKGIEDPAMIGKNLPTFHNRLYEFPSKTFGTRKSSSWEGVLGDTNVDVMGKNHLYYGDTSSGVRGPVRIISDTNADYLGISPYKIGITDRPLKINGLYDKTPVYEDIYMGNQTVLNGKELQEAIQNSTYNIFDHTPLFFMGKDATPSGITKIIHINK